jgi:hypothetical protein
MATDNNVKPEKKRVNNKKVALGCGIIFVVIILISVGIGTCVSNTPSTTVELEASISFDGTQFHITNNNNFTWIDAKFKLNDDYKYSATMSLQPGNEYTVGALQFTKDDGTRFNPFTSKALKMSVSCQTSDGKTGHVSVGWK